MIPNYPDLKISLQDHIAQIQLDRPQKANALSLNLWENLGNAFKWVQESVEVHVVLLSGTGPIFSAGIDLLDFSTIFEKPVKCEGLLREELRKLIKKLQQSLTEIEQCGKPVIAAIQGGCIGGGLNLVAACDMRFCTADAYFTLKEVDLAMTADVGALQRLPHLISDGILRELAYTGRKVLSAEAQSIGLVNRVLETTLALEEHCLQLARQIAEKSPLAIRGIKEMLLYSRDHSVADGLNYVATWNAGMLISNDLVHACQKIMSL